MELVSAHFKKYRIVKIVKENEDYTSLICERKNKQFFVRKFKTIEDFNKSIKQYTTIKKLGINIPKMLIKSKKNLVIFYKFIDSENCAETLVREDIPDNYFDKLFLIHRFAKFSKIDLNYLPENFRFYKGDMFYMSYEFFPIGSEKNFEDYGLFHWFYGMEAMNHLNDLGLPIDRKRVLTVGEVKKKVVLLSIMKW